MCQSTCRERQTALEHLRRCSASLWVRETRIKIAPMARRPIRRAVTGHDGTAVAARVDAGTHTYDRNAHASAEGVWATRLRNSSAPFDPPPPRRASYPLGPPPPARTNGVQRGASWRGARQGLPRLSVAVSTRCQAGARGPEPGRCSGSCGRAEVQRPGLGWDPRAPGGSGGFRQHTASRLSRERESLFPLSTSAHGSGSHEGPGPPTPGSGVREQVGVGTGV